MSESSRPSEASERLSASQAWPPGNNSIVCDQSQSAAPSFPSRRRVVCRVLPSMSALSAGSMLTLTSGSSPAGSASARTSSLCTAITSWFVAHEPDLATVGAAASLVELYAAANDLVVPTEQLDALARHVLPLGEDLLKIDKGFANGCSALRSHREVDVRVLPRVRCQRAAERVPCAATWKELDASAPLHTHPPLAAQRERGGGGGRFKEPRVGRLEGEAHAAVCSARGVSGEEQLMHVKPNLGRHAARPRACALSVRYPSLSSSFSASPSSDRTAGRRRGGERERREIGGEREKRKTGEKKILGSTNKRERRESGSPE
eukprot:scaffold292072_cov27-Tisochrysis_lutea.AAC.2